MNTFQIDAIKTRLREFQHTLNRERMALDEHWVLWLDVDAKQINALYDVHIRIDLDESLSFSEEDVRYLITNRHALGGQNDQSDKGDTGKSGADAVTASSPEGNGGTE